MHVQISFSICAQTGVVLFQKSKSTQIYICCSTPFSPCFIILDKENFVKVSHWENSPKECTEPHKSSFSSYQSVSRWSWMTLNDQCFHIIWFIWTFQKNHAANRAGSFKLWHCIQLYTAMWVCTLRKESSQTNIILQYKLLTAILSAVCSLIQKS